ncbi:MAG TPA: hypothetical protein VJB90_00720 [Candidatus Nanoarchaeia archaeon]|nr:hypothetical protein [Candidatus Nanoarchaeia archaeon]
MPKSKLNASEEISNLLSFAKSKARTHPKESRSAIKLAWKLSQKFRKRLSSEQKKAFCNKCFTYYIPAVTATIRVGKSRVAYHCLYCSTITKYPYKKEQKAKRNI